MSPTSIAHVGTGTLDVSSVYRFMRPACEVFDGTESLAFMSGSPWKRSGEIVAGDCCYRVGRGKMLPPRGRAVATYAISERFMRFTRVVLCDLVSHREFELRQKQIWRGALVLCESNIPIAEFVPDIFQRHWRIELEKEMPQSIVLLSIWLAVVASVFNA